MKVRHLYHSCLASGYALRKPGTKHESGVLEQLARQPGRIVSRQEVLKNLWDSADYFSGRSLDVYIGRLRKLLEQDAHIRLESVRGSGFILHLLKDN
ncbi:winged helix-turn-helix domain-containing protein [Mucilaginibacter endophyticus]|uniref:winged helix-turn-helix domain-containing protein n=1 Tax=Mucilaginibacter endophyticus TaxID=2675003 RepID=UPI000E0D8FC4|nr:winged helix-turn-helix domain-containing protein [Mucilaginibacter endophyticus]